MRVKASEISGDYVRDLRQLGRSWSVIARMTGASEMDLKRWHGGLVLDSASPVPSIVPSLVPVAVPALSAREVVAPKAPAKPKAKAVRKVARRVAAPKQSKAADGRLSAVLVAAGMGLDEAGVVVRMYRAGGKRQEAAALMPAGIRSPALIKKRMAEVKNSAGRLGIKLSGGLGGYCLRPDSLHFVGRLEAVNCGGEQ